MDQPFSITIAKNAPLETTDIALVSIDYRGIPGSLNKLVFETLGYSENDYPKANDLKQGYYLLRQPDKVSVLFVVTVGGASTEANLESNLKKALLDIWSNHEFNEYWIPLMGTGSGGLDHKKSFDITFSVLTSLARKTTIFTKIVIALPNSTDNEEEDYFKKRIKNWEEAILDTDKDKVHLSTSANKSSNSDDTKFLKHALSTEEEDRNLINKGYSNQGLIGYLNSRKGPNTAPLHQTYIVGEKDYFYYLDRSLESLSKYKTTEEKIIGYLSTIAIAEETQFFRFMNDETYDHFYCTNPDQEILKKLNYFHEPKNGFEKVYLLTKQSESTVPLFVYSTNPELKLFKSPVLEEKDPAIASPEASPFSQEDIQRKIDSNNKEGKDFWWLNAVSNRWSMESLNVGGYEEYTAIGKSGRYVQYAKDLKKGDLAIGYQGQPDQKIIGICEIEKEYKENDRIGFRLIDKFPHQKTLEQLKHDNLFRNSSLTRNLAGSFKKVPFDLFNRLVELGYLPPQDPNEQKSTQIDNDGAFSTEDLLDIENDVRSFALLLASKSVKPPLAIALFGKWGLGKSFFMKHLQKRIDELSKNQGFLIETEATGQAVKSDKDQFCSGIAQIEFNAWSYLDANLWAGLVASIFEKLNEYLTDSTKSGVAKMKVVEKLKERLKTFQTLRLSEEERKDELVNLKIGYEIEQQNLKKSIKQNFSKNILQIIKADKELNAVYSTIEKDGHLTFLTEELKLDQLQKDARALKSFIRNLKKIKALWPYIAAAIVGIAIAYGLKEINLGEWGWSGIAPVLAYFGINWTVLKRRYSKIMNFVNRFNDSVQKNAELNEKVQAHQELVKDADEQIEEADQQIAQLDEKIEDFQRYMENEIYQETIKDFIQTRADHPDYKDKLGIVSIIRRDFETLSELFYESESKETETNNEESEITEDKELIREQFSEGRKLERIILYIDDLDRCDDEKVLEIIQAVHLLMAFPLFNVVVGVDKRCVRNALLLKTKLQYRKIAPLEEIEELGIHMISPGEYLEKIFQIPFELREPNPKDFENLADFLLKNQIKEEAIEEVKKEEIPSAISKEKAEEKVGEEPAPQEEKKEEAEPEREEIEDEAKEEDKIPEEPKTTTVLVSSAPDNLLLSQLEVDQLKQMLLLVGNTPRTIKRFINIYRIIRAHKRPEMEKELKKEDHLAIMFLLAIGIGEYKLWRDEIYLLLLEYPTNQLNTLLKKIKGEEEFKEETQQLKNKFKEIEDLAKIREVLKLKGDQFAAHIPFLTRFSFGKEITTPEPEMQSA